MAKQTDLLTLWRTIVQAGGQQAYIQAQLREHGYLVERRETDQMSEKELEDYKKSLKAEAAENLRRSADVNDGEMGRKRWWDDFEVSSGKEEVEAAGDDEENGEENAANHTGSLPSSCMSRLLVF